MTETARLVLAVDSTDIDRGERSLKRLDSAAGKTERETKNLTRATDQMSGAYRGLRTVLATVGAGLLVRELVQASDTYTELRSQIKLVTDSQEELNAVFSESYDLANETRGSLETTINLYARMARATEELDLANKDLFTITKAVNQSFVVSGASAQESSAAILQLSQGMASGTLRGEELNSVMENSPRLARAIAEGLGVTIGELRQLGADGKITAEAITTALLSTADSIDREFQQMPRTVGQSLQQLRNDLLVTFGQTDTSEFVSAIDDLRSIVTDPGFQDSMVTLGTAIADVAGALASATKETVGFTKWLGEELASKIDGIAEGDLVRLNDRLEEQRELVEIIRKGKDDFFFNPSLLEQEEKLLAEYTKQYQDAVKAQEQAAQQALKNRIALQKKERSEGFADEILSEMGGGPSLGGDSGGSDAIQKRIDALNLEAQTLGMTATQADLYKLAVDGATQSQIRAAEQAYATIDAHEAEKEAIERNLESRRAAAEIVAEMEAERQKKIDGGEQLLEQYATEEELLNLHHQNRLEILEAARAADYDNKAKWDAAIMDEEENHEKNLTAMKRAEWESRVSITSGYLGMLSGLMSSENRKMFEIGKAAAIAQATVDTIAGSVRVFKDLPIWAAIPASAALLLTGFARVSAIQSTTFGGGGGGSLGGSPGISGGVQTVPAAPAPVQLDGAGGGNGNGINIYFQGDVNGLDEDSLTQALVGKLGEQINDLDYVLINKTSRQGRELSGD
ncbi:tape measure protein [Alcanivorax jadensis]|uniref:tape measure protein n=1 Tax=Alcanivorax jadensis TaxID=64988 RepID=UPI00235455A4|nr:tape measure protein [Alcanivorax jadensis]